MKNQYKKYLFLGALLFALLSLPPLFIHKGRVFFANFFSPLWKTCSPSSLSSPEQTAELEAHLLRMEISKLRALLAQESVWKSMQQELSSKDFPLRRYEESAFLLGTIPQIVPARIIYRDPSNWSTIAWINVGEETNNRLNAQVVCKNSPVVLGRSAVGVVDTVGAKQSRIRLISDPSLKISVRAVRGMIQNVHLIEHLEFVLHHLTSRYDLKLNDEKRCLIIQELEALKQELGEERKVWHLAKGLVQGSSSALWREMGPCLKGVGFNFDFADEEGPARELMTGKPVGDINGVAVPILKLSDLLITTGMDGVFPAGLRVGEVTKILPFQEGAYAYEIEATPTAHNFTDLQTVFILPPI